MAGDTNCRTKCNDDFISQDSLNHLPLPKTYIAQPHSNNVLDSRNNTDTKINDGGKWLLDLCITKQLLIVNGRVTGDIVGNYTYYGPNGSSTVDYFITHQSILNLVNYMKVHELTTISDHCAISMNIRLPFKKSDPDPKENGHNLKPHGLSFKWLNDSKLKFQNALNLNQLKLLEIFNGDYEQSPNGVDQFTKLFTDYILDISKLSLKVISRSSKKRKSKNSKSKLSFDKDCLNMKKDLLIKLKLMNQYPHNRVYREEYYKYRRVYRKSIKSKELDYKDNILMQLENLKDNDSKSYWELLEKLRNKKSQNGKTNGLSAEEWHQYFKNLSFKTYDYSLNSKINKLEKLSDKTDILDYDISEKELHSCISSLKRGRINGPDLILNEMIISGRYFLSPSILKLLNMCLHNSYFPELWNYGLISPIHKKGSLHEAENFRGICITSSLGKLFTSILQQRLLSFLNENKKLSENQAGFIPGHRTTDNIFILSQLIDYAKTNKKPLFLAFIDFKKAFDTIWHEGLLFKLLEKGLGGKFYGVIKSIYRTNLNLLGSTSLESCTVTSTDKAKYPKSNINLAVKLPDGITDSFPCNIGVKQGDCISPILFNCYIDQIISTLAVDIKHGFKVNDNTMINSILYADDLVIFSHSHREMQLNLNKLHNFCTQWKLTVNMKKSQVIVLNGQNAKKTLYIDGDALEYIDSYDYLGVKISRSGLKLAPHNLALKAQKAWFSLKHSFQSVNKKNIRLILKIFDCCLKPILSYGSEVWCPYFSNNDYMNLKNKSEHIQLQLCKWLLGVSRRCSNLGTLAEIGRFPLVLSFQINLLKYWLHVTSKPKDSLLYQVFLFSKKKKTRWYKYIEKLLSDLKIDINNINLDDQESINNFISQVKSKLYDHYNALWKSKIAVGTRPHLKSKMRTYIKFKTSITFENYLSYNDIEKRQTVTKIRLSDHLLNIETGRRHNIKTENRLCKFCNTNSVEDEFHFIISCNKYSSLRNALFSKLSKNDNNFSKLSPDEKFIYIINLKSNSEDILTYINKCYHLRILNADCH